jgi:uncharacterized OB-fold protein
MTDADARDEGYDDFLDAVAAGEGFYLECPAGHGSLPPRRACPQCGSQELSEEPLPATGEIETHTTIHVATPEFADDTPYVTAVVDFGPVRVTGMLREEDSDDVETGTTVVPAVGETATTGERVLLFHRG